MKLTVCIPVYNRDVRELVNQLHQQGKAVPGGCEILLADDASDTTYTELNRPLEALANCTIIACKTNIGRSAIRNLLCDHAQGEWLLFLDCDMLLPHTHFIERYIRSTEVRADVYVGGLVYPRAVNKRDNPIHLRWRYGVNREEIPAEIRNESPYNSFMTGNFIVRREVMMSIRLDESISGYGHEDTLFGIELKRKGHTVLHIQNPTVHMGIDSDPDFIEKTRQSIRNLAMLYKAGKVVPEDVGLLGAAIVRGEWKKRLFARLFGLLFNELPPASRKIRLFDAWRLRELLRALRD